jgi:chaperonin GroES
MSCILKTRLTINKELIESPNLTDKFDADDLVKIGQLVWEGYDRDKFSRSTWEKRSEAAMDLALQIQKDKSFPWPGAANVVFPLISISALQFSARAYGNIVQGVDVVRYRVTGDDPDGLIQEKADRIAKHMSWQVLEEDTSWEEQHDRLLINLSIVGTAFVKSYFSPSLGHNVSELVLARDLVLDYYAKSVESCSRKTHIVPMYRNEIYERVVAGTFADVLDESWYKTNSAPPVAPPQTGRDNRRGQSIPTADIDTPFVTLEQHRLLDLDGDGYAEPYIVTIEVNSKKVLRIVARFDTEQQVIRSRTGKILRIEPTEYFTKYPFIPAPDGGIYDIGFGVLLGPLNESVNSGINQLLDAGTMQNSTGGFLGRGAKIRGGTYTMAPWEWKRVDSTGDDLRKNLVPFPEKQPSAVVFQLLQLLIEYTDRLAGTVDQMVGITPGQNTPAETSRNALEQGMQVYSMIFKRVWRAMKEEFKKLHKLNSVFLDTEVKFGQGDMLVYREDYKSDPNLIAPVADPNVTSNSMRFAQAQAVAQRAMGIPGYDIPEVEKRFLKALRVDGIDKVYPGTDKVPPLPNPKMEVENAKLQGKKMQLDNDRFKFILNLRMEARKVYAQIGLMEAQAAQALAGVDAERAGLQLQAMDTAITAMKAHADLLDKQAAALESQGDNSAGNDGAGVSGMAQSSGDAGVLPASQGMEGSAEGAMG